MGDGARGSGGERGRAGEPSVCAPGRGRRHWSDEEKAREEGVTQAPTPAHLIEGALPTEGMLAHVLVSKFADHLPLYRQAQIYARSGVELHRSTLADWVGKTSFHLRPVFECLKEELKTSNNLGLDETTVRVLDPGRGKTKTGYM